MNPFVVTLYNSIPASLKKRFGQSAKLKWLRTLLLQTNNTYKTSTVQVSRMYGTQPVTFKFVAPVKIAARALQRGIENTLLNNSISLFKQQQWSDNAVIFDVGANFGYLSLVWSQTLAKNGQVFAFEANTWVSDCLVKSVFQNDLQRTITVVNNAVGDVCKPVQLFLNHSSSNVLDLHHIDNSVTIDMISIDSYVKQQNISGCDLIKIDVDGIEPAILNGAKETILKFQPMVIVETNNNMDIITWFENIDYHILTMKLEPYIKGDVLPPNIFCLPKTAL
ncbi:FkbM family methyltransferase [Pseudoalteromonas sp.]|uniref:FkbM family methyltransferase n=1 Tax=Pseudoalteromonas sp. TaxID=53249 RepID=UPI001BCB6262|nr:FkbM family methyltransferase [Pseudoalteromonas sp.]